MAFFAKGNMFFPIMSTSETTMKNKLEIRTFQKGGENGLGEGLGWKPVGVFFSPELCFNQPLRKVFVGVLSSQCIQA